ncbi:MAG: hypothetical protein RIT24_2313, partial [Planctomycetota bacterium]
SNLHDRVKAMGGGGDKTPAPPEPTEPAATATA